MQRNTVNMKSSRKVRIILGFFLPPGIGCLILTLPKILLELIKGNSESFNISFGILFFAYILFLIPSLAYSFLMEYWVNKKFDDDRSVIGMSSFLGATLGSILGIFFPLIILGAIVGAIVGVILRKSYNNDLGINKPLC